MFFTIIENKRKFLKQIRGWHCEISIPANDDVIWMFDNVCRHVIYISEIGDVKRMYTNVIYIQKNTSFNTNNWMKLYECFTM